IGLAPSLAARERIVSALTPAASATAMAACSTRSRLSGTRLSEPSLVGFNFAFPDDSTPILCMVPSCTKYGGQHGPSDRKKQAHDISSPQSAVVLVGGEGGGRLIGGAMGRSIQALALSPFVSQRIRMIIESEIGGFAAPEGAHRGGQGDSGHRPDVSASARFLTPSVICMTRSGKVLSSACEPGSRPLTHPQWPA